ncbi:23S rRNA (adenine(1618)-N(6))-methyltransferase RlmF [Shewanella sp. SNU WT4]|uniref:23S rRNA (adenine(1618)-N(6))-methyltransferase RlmF n=1 Tax=Shewanella sp. SNU WT4 TaxID=2590015 RepID=UPI0011278065|nr:23S rRNA (adenine(1618)-N(6))-methyltransferase RlmF [Shewanella sp. SNU WT4]
MAFKHTKKIPAPLDKVGLHPRNIHNKGYDFERLCLALPSLSSFSRDNGYGRVSIDFANPDAVKSLNSAILLADYGIKGWSIPAGALCPPIPGRVDYIHHIADLLLINNKPITGKAIKLLDIGTGANGVYPLLGHSSYGWQFVASDIAQASLDNVAAIIKANPLLTSALQLRLQSNPSAIFKGIIQAGELFDITLCNPPFHESAQAATQAATRKVNNLGLAKGQAAEPKLNFGGQANELWCQGGELGFLTNMINESREFSHQCLWFTSLVSKGENLAPCRKLLTQLGADEVKVIEMQQGNKLTRVLAWSYLPAANRKQWLKLKAQQPKFGMAPSFGI